MLQQIGLTQTNSISITSLLINMAVGVALALAVQWHFRRYGSTLSNREELAHILPFILLTTVLIIFIVKSSLALSLGLVGALSIVRFRTPIKEPEELAYLFICIAMGLGLGASQTVPTVVAGLAILAVMAALKQSREAAADKNLYLSIDGKFPDAQAPEQYLEKINATLAEFPVGSDLRRFDVRDGAIDATYFLAVDRPETLGALTEELCRRFPNIGVTFLDQSRMPSV